jgi:polyisoprenoid-binding protein YceI
MKVSAVVSAFTLALGLAMQPASADSGLKTLKIDPGHTYPSFEVDHGGGLSILRGKFNSTSGTIMLDREGKTGTIDITIDATSLDFGHDKFNEHVKSPDMLDVAKHPTASYKGKLADFQNGAPTKAKGELTLRGVTKPVELTIDRFLCRAQPSGKEICGANATGKFDRADFGIDYGKNRGFFMDVTLAIGVEAKEE